MTGAVSHAEVWPLPCRSGSISREELTKYLLHASAICSKLGLAFLHAFQEVTFRKPTFCHSCSGFVSTGPVSTLGSRLPWIVSVPHTLTWASVRAGLWSGWGGGGTSEVP